MTFENIQKQEFIGSSELKMLCAWLYGWKPELKCVVEIGVATGGSTRTWNRLLAKDGRYIGIDINLYDPKQGLYGEVAKTILKYEDDDRMRFLIADSRLEETVETVRKMLAGRLVDFLYIDGEHSESGARKDYDLYEPFVESGGIIAFHDASSNTNVRKAIDSIADVFNNVQVGPQSWQYVGPKAKHVCRFDSKMGHCGIVAIIKE
jgi:predicted O-methyltransferase YrrM